MDQSDHDFLIKLGVRVAALENANIALETRLEKYVTKEENYPVKLIAYGLVGSSVLALLTAIISTVLQ